ncbi:MAG: hypothetical protein H0W73_17330 [Bacteroidetes bacterium]|nr:hypothetical protein [Bacteroidota bacterium]
MGIKINKKQQSNISGAILSTKQDDALPCTDQKVENTKNSLNNSESIKEGTIDEEIDLKLSQTDEDVDELDEEEEDERIEENNHT